MEQIKQKRLQTISRIVFFCCAGLIVLFTMLEFLGNITLYLSAPAHLIVLLVIELLTVVSLFLGFRLSAQKVLKWILGGVIVAIVIANFVLSLPTALEETMLVMPTERGNVIIREIPLQQEVQYDFYLQKAGIFLHHMNPHQKVRFGTNKLSQNESQLRLVWQNNGLVIFTPDDTQGYYISY